MINSRVSWVDTAKAIGILLVVFGHVWRGLIKPGLLEQGNLFLFVDRYVYAFHMPLFFFLSGIFLEKNIKRFGAYVFCVRRTVVLLWTYLCWAVIYLALEQRGDFSLIYDRIFSSLLFPNTHLWFLLALCLCSIAAAIIYWIFNERFSIIGFFIGLIAFLSVQASDAGLVGQVTAWLVYLFVGIIWSRNQEKFSFGVIQSIVGLLIVCTWTYWSVINNVDLTGGGGRLTRFGLALAGVIFVVGLSQHCTCRWLCYVGKQSLPIYLMHIMVLVAVRIILVKFGVSDVLLHVLFGMLASIIIPLIVHKLLAKWPSWLALEPPPFIAWKRSTES